MNRYVPEEKKIIPKNIGKLVSEDEELGTIDDDGDTTVDLVDEMKITERVFKGGYKKPSKNYDSPEETLREYFPSDE